MNAITPTRDTFESASVGIGCFTVIEVEAIILPHF